MSHDKTVIHGTACGIVGINDSDLRGFCFVCDEGGVGVPLVGTRVGWALPTIMAHGIPTTTRRKARQTMPISTANAWERWAIAHPTRLLLRGRDFSRVDQRLKSLPRIQWRRRGRPVVCPFQPGTMCIGQSRCVSKRTLQGCPAYNEEGVGVPLVGTLPVGADQRVCPDWAGRIKCLRQYTKTTQQIPNTRRSQSSIATMDISITAHDHFVRDVTRRSTPKPSSTTRHAGLSHSTNATYASFASYTMKEA